MTCVPTSWVSRGVGADGSRHCSSDIRHFNSLARLFPGDITFHRPHTDLPRGVTNIGQCLNQQFSDLYVWYVMFKSTLNDFHFIVSPKFQYPSSLLSYIDSCSILGIKYDWYCGLHIDLHFLKFYFILFWKPAC